MKGGNASFIELFSINPYYVFIGKCDTVFISTLAGTLKQTKAGFQNLGITICIYLNKC